MVSPLPRNKRAKNPRVGEGAPAPVPADTSPPEPTAPLEPERSSFTNNPFAKLEA